LPLTIHPLRHEAIDKFVGRVTEGQVRGLVERAYFAALSNQQGSVMVPQQEVAPFVQGVVSEAMVSVFTGQLSQ
jgi:hypothetical protein